MGSKTRLRRRRPGSRSARSRLVHPKTADELFALPERQREQWEHVTRVVSHMREDGISLLRAAREAHVRPQTIVRLARSALKKSSSGRWMAKTRDRLLRVFTVAREDGRGLRELPTTDSREASKVARYDAAVGRLVRGRDPSAVRALPFRSVTDANGRRVRLLTDVDALQRLAEAGVLSFESIYARR